MGYYATYELALNFTCKDKETTELQTKLSNLLDNYTWDNADIRTNEINIGNDVILEAYGYDKYHEDDVEEFLDEIIKLTDKFPLSSGTVEFIGEDHSFWRYLYRDGKFIEQDGKIVYNDL